MKKLKAAKPRPRTAKIGKIEPSKTVFSPRSDDSTEACAAGIKTKNDRARIRFLFVIFSSFSKRGVFKFHFGSIRCLAIFHWNDVDLVRKEKEFEVQRLE